MNIVDKQPYNKLIQIISIVNSSASLSRPVGEIEGTQFCSNLSGFAVCSVGNDKFTLNFLNRYGKSIYTYSKIK